MNVFRTFRGRKYLQRILLSFIPVVAILAVASYLLNVNARGKVLATQNEADLRLLSQINYNIDNMNGIVKDLAVSLYNDDELIALKAGSDYRQSILKVDRLDRTVAESPYLHAVAFYNPAQRRFFSSLNHDMGNDQLYAKLSGYIQGHPDLPKLQLLPLSLHGEDGIDAFALFLFDGPKLGSVNGNVLVLTVKPGWMLDNVKTLNRLAERDNDALFVADGEGNMLISSEREQRDLAGMKDALLGRIGASSQTLDTFTYTYQGTKYKVTYLSKGSNNWSIVSLRDYDAVLGSVRQMKWTEIAVTLFVVLLAVLLSVFFSLRLYRPVGQLYSLVRAEDRQGAAVSDEMTVIAANYRGMLDKLQHLELEQASQANIAKAYQLRSLLGDSDSIPEPELQRNIAQYGLDIFVPGALCVAVARLDGLAELTAAQGPQAESLLSFAIVNIGQELLRQSYACEATDMKNGHLVFLVSSSGTALELSAIKERIAELQRTIRSYYSVSFTASLSEVFADSREITARYKLALRQSDYRLLLGKGAVIDPERVREQERSQAFRVPAELERQLSEGLRAGDRERAEDAIARWREAVGVFSFEQAFAALLRMATGLSHTLGELSHYQPHPVSFDLQAINRRILGQETLEEIAAVLSDVVREAIDQRRSGKEDKSRLIADTIKEIVDKHYADPDLNVQKIADMLKMSPVYLGQTFKAQEDGTVVDLINTTRLARARQYLEQQDYTVAEIMVKVGFGNESYFYRLFKRRYGVTPKEYRLKFSIDSHT